MKRKNATFTFKERYDDLSRAYKEVLLRFNFNTQEDTLAKAIELPSVRFWVSAKRLAEVITAIEMGDMSRCGNSPLRQEMYKEMYRRYLALKKDPANRYATKTDLCYAVIFSQAPKFYITPKYAHKIFKKGRRGDYDEE